MKNVNSSAISIPVFNKSRTLRGEGLHRLCLLSNPFMHVSIKKYWLKSIESRTVAGELSPSTLMTWYKNAQKYITWKHFLLKCLFRSFPGGPRELTLHRNPVKRSIAWQWDSHPWHGAPFDVPSDGHAKPLTRYTIQYRGNWWKNTT